MSRIPVLRTSPRVWQLLGPALYSQSPLVAITLRELFQNARDACLSPGREPEISIKLEGDGDFTRGVLSCEDNGIGMDEDTILDRFLVLGGSKKSAGSTGGFGIAKATILGACAWWEVHTRDLYVCYDHLEEGRPIDRLPERVGTRVSLRYDPPGDDRQSKAIRLGPYKFARGVSWIAHSDAPCVVRVELAGLEPQEWQLPGLDVTGLKPLYQGGRGTTRWAVYQLHALDLAGLSYKYGDGVCVASVFSTGYAFFRANGLVQFSEQLSRDHPHCFVVEVQTEAEPGSPDYPFTPSREELVGELNERVEDCLEAHKRNPLTSASRHRNRDRPKDQVFYDGRWMGKGKAQRLEREKERLRLAQEVTEGVQVALRHSSLMEEGGPVRRLQSSPLGIKLLMKGLSHTRRNVLLPHNLRLLEVWGHVVELVIEANGVDERFGIGFVFDTEALAERYSSSEGVFYLLNPKGLAVTRAAETLLVMLGEACHEVAHGYRAWHDEAFSSRQGELLRGSARLFAARRRDLERILAGRKSRRERDGVQPALL